MGMLQVDLRVTIRLKVGTGVLPKDAPVRMWALERPLVARQEPAGARLEPQDPPDLPRARGGGRHRVS
jgi:hypothetical protein